MRNTDHPTCFNSEVEKPTPKDNEILVKVRAASVNAGDWHALRGTPFLQRLESGFPKPKNKILGADVAGLVEAVGSKVTRFQPGDEVYGDLYWCGFGAFAEYVYVSGRCSRSETGQYFV